MLRTQISLSAEERRVLDAESARTGRSLSALVRDAVDRVYGIERDIEAELASLEAGFGGWNERVGDLDGAAYVEQVRSGSRLERDR